jgi:hypothetical protein
MTAKFTATQHKRIAARYIEQAQNTELKDEKERCFEAAQRHVQAYIEMTGNTPE